MRLLNCAVKTFESRLKKYFKYIAITLIAVLSSFVLSTKAEFSNKKDLIAEVETITSLETETKISLEYHPKETTFKVGLKLDSLLQRINKRHDFHGSILVAKNRKIVYNNHIGYADFGKKEYISHASTYQLASVSKQFTAAAIMLLYERNQIQLTDTVNTYFPEFPYENVTIKNLLNHTAGLPKYFWVAEHKWKKEKAPTNSEMMELLTTSGVQRFFKPGRNFDYSNTGYMVLASIVEKVTGTSFAQFLKDNIFEPLDMKDSFVYSFENDPIKDNQLTGYRIYKGWRHLKIRGTVNDAIVGDKNVYSTPEDLFKWILGLNGEKLLSQESINLMYSKGETVYGRKVPYGFGFRIDTKGPKIIYHHGKWNGFNTGLTQYPEDELVLIILEHTSYTSIKSLNEKVRKIVRDNFGV